MTGNEPGASAWSSKSVTCAQDSDCQTGEVCGAGVCQMKRCAGADYKSAPPLGQTGYVMLDHELVVSTGTSSLQVYNSKGSSLVQGTGLSAATSPLDVAGGNFTGKRPQQLAYIAQGSNPVQIMAPDGSGSSLNPGWQGTFLAAGDVDGDGLDEVVVTGGTQQYAVCSVARAKCDPGSLPWDAADVAVGDVDGDGFAEAIFVSGTSVSVLNVNYQTTGEQQFVTTTITPTLTNISAGDLDGDGVAEVIGREYGGMWSWDKDHLYVFDVASGQLAQQAEFDVPQVLLDVSYARFANKGRFASLGTDASVQVFSYAKGALTMESTTSGPSGATRLAAADVDGNSPTVSLKAGPTLQAGPAVPVAVITLPPYSTTHSSGPSSATVGTTQDNGTSQSQGMSTSTSVSLTLGVGLGFPIPLPAQLGIYLTGHAAWSTSMSQQTSSDLSIGASYTITANPQLDGYDSAGIVLGCGCFHQYDYMVDDPAGMLGQGQASQTMSLFIPVGGQTTFWSVHRYNALADALGSGKLPKINVGYKLGDTKSYPQAPATLDGMPIAADDMVFPSPPIVRTSDIGSLNFSLTASQSQTNTTASSFSYGASIQAGITLWVVSVTASADETWTLDQSYSVTVGHSTTFSGQVQPIHDDPSTPENEALLYGYAFEPLVYKHHFMDATGKNGALYVLTYAMTQ